jgi:hypothetical protein
MLSLPLYRLKFWTNGQQTPMPDRRFKYRGVDASDKPLKSILYKDLDLDLPWESFEIVHELTTKGIQNFVADYRSTLRRSA